MSATTAHASARLRAALLLVLGLLCGGLAPSGAAAAGPAPEPPRVQPFVPVALYELSPRDGDPLEEPRRGTHRLDRRHAPTAPAGPAGPQASPGGAAPRTEPPAGNRGSPGTRPRTAAPDPSALQVFRC